MENENEKEVVCVTGGTGYVASWLIMRLLQRGYTVRTTVRPDPEGTRDISFLTNLPEASERLHVFHADMSNPSSFDEALKGCMGVFHVAHTMDIMGIEPEEVVIKRCVEATLGILKACQNSKTVKRVVYTSSVATAVFSGKNVDIIDESSWSDVDYCRSMKLKGTIYVASKMETEKQALIFSEKNGLDLVTILPSMVAGPFLTSHVPGSVEWQLTLIKGKKDQYGQVATSAMVHIDDVASAHIFLFENPNAKGRYICSSHRLSILEMSKLLCARYPEYPVPSADELKDIKGQQVSNGFLSSKKLLDAGFKYKHSVEDMFDGAIQSCKERGFL